MEGKPFSCEVDVATVAASVVPTEVLVAASVLAIGVLVAASVLATGVLVAAADVAMGLLVTAADVATGVLVAVSVAETVLVAAPVGVKRTVEVEVTTEGEGVVYERIHKATSGTETPGPYRELLYVPL